MKNTVFCTSLNSEDLELYKDLNAPKIVLEGLVGLYRNSKEDLDALPSLREMRILLNKHYSPNSNSNHLVDLVEILRKSPRDKQGKLLAPNGKPSNLTETQYAIVRTPSFKRWFGDWEKGSTKTNLDKNGEPSKEYLEKKEQEGAFTPMNFNTYNEPSEDQYNAIDIEMDNLATEQAIEANKEKVYSIKAAKSLFYKYNKDSGTKLLADKVFKIAETLGLKFHFMVDIDVPARYRGDVIEISSIATTNQNIDKIPHIILHELLHAVTVAQIEAYNNGTLKNTAIIEAVEAIKTVYSSIKNENLVQGEYGITGEKEMIAELANPSFRNKLKRLNVWEKVKQAIKNIFIKYSPLSTTASRVLNNALDTLLNNYDIKIFNSYLKSIDETTPWDNIDVMPKNIQKSEFSRNVLEKDTLSLVIFTDNATRSSGSKRIESGWYKEKYGQDREIFHPTKTQAVARGLDNAFPISTVKSYEKGKGATKWEDSDYVEATAIINAEFEDIKKAWLSGKYRRIVVGNGKKFLLEGAVSLLTNERTPRLYEFIESKLQEFFTFIDNSSQRTYTNDETKKDSVYILGKEGTAVGKIIDPTIATLNGNTEITIREGMEAYKLGNTKTILEAYQEIKNSYDFLTENELKSVYTKLWNKWLVSNAQITVDGVVMKKKDVLIALIKDTMTNTVLYSEPNNEVNTAEAIYNIITSYFNYSGSSFNKKASTSVQTSDTYTTNKPNVDRGVRIRNFSSREWERYKKDYPEAYVVSEEDKKVISDLLKRIRKNKPANVSSENELFYAIRQAFLEILNDTSAKSFFNDFSIEHGNAIKDIIWISEKTEEQEIYDVWPEGNYVELFRLGYLNAINQIPIELYPDVYSSEINNSLSKVADKVFFENQEVAFTGSEKLQKIPFATRELCTNLVGNYFKIALDSVLLFRIEELEANINDKTLDINDKLKLISLLSRLNSNDTTEVMNALLEDENTIEEVIKEVRDGLIELKNEVLEDNNVYTLLDTLGEDTDAFYAYLEYCSGAIQDFTGGLRVEFTPKEIDTTEEAYEESNVEESEKEEADAELSPANAGWGYKAKFTDYYASLAKSLRRMLATIESPNNDDNSLVRVYLPISHTYNTLLSLCATHVTYVEDFVIYKDGEYSFPLFEKFKDTYPWLDTVENALIDDPTLISAFYRNFCLDFMRYLSVDEEVDEFGDAYTAARVLNAPSMQDNVVKPMLQILENGIELEKGGIHSNLEHEEFTTRKADIKQEIENLKLLKDFDDKSLSSLTSVLNKIGLAISKDDVKRLLGGESKEQEAKRKDVLKDAELVVENYHWNTQDNRPKTSTVYNYARRLARDLGYLPVAGNTLSFTYQDKMRQSYAPASFFDKLFKIIRTYNLRGLQELVDSFSKDLFYYRINNSGEKEFINPFIQRIADRLEAAKKGKKTIITEFTPFNTADLIYIDGKEFGSWESKDIEKAFLKWYFKNSEGDSFELDRTPLMWYNMPITANSPSTQMVMLERTMDQYSENDYLDSLNQKYGANIVGSIYSLFYNSYNKLEIFDNSLNNYGHPSCKVIGLMPLYVDIVKQELARIKRVQDRAEESVEKISGLDSDGLRFCTIPELNTLTIKGKTLIEVLNIENADTDTKEACIHLYTATVVLNKAEKYLMEYEERHIDAEGNFSSPYSKKDVYEYYWDNFITTALLSQLVYGDPAYHSDEITQAKRAKESGAAGPRPCTSIEEGKTHSQTIVVKDKIVPSKTFPFIKKIISNLPIISKTKKRSLLKDALNINSTDGQAYRTIESARILYKMMNLWNNAMEDTYNNLLSGSLSEANLYTNFQPIKSFVYTVLGVPDGNTGNIFRVPVQLKHCEAILIDAYSGIGGNSKQSAKMKALHEFLRDNNIDVLEFASNNKVGMYGVLDVNFNPNNVKQMQEYLAKESLEVVESLKGKHSYDEIKDVLDDAVIDNKISWEAYLEALDMLDYSEDQLEEMKKYLITNIYTDSSKTEYNAATVKSIPYADFIEAQPTPEHLFDTTHLIGGQFKHIIKSNLPEKAVFNIEGKKYSGKDIKALINEILTINTLEGYNVASNKMQSLEDIRSIIVDQIRSNSKLGKHLIDFFDIVQRDNGDSFAIPINYPGNTSAIRQALYAIMRKNIAKRHTNGGAATAISSYGYDLSMLFEEAGGKVRIKGVECMLPFQYREMYAEYIDSEGQLDTRKLPEELRRIIGYRIPTEDKYSIIPLYVKGFLPSYMGSTIMVAPEAMVWLTGGDHDGDHVHMMFPNFKTINGKARKIEYDLSKDVKSFNKKQRDNALFDLAWTVMTSPDVTEQILSPGHFDDMKWGKIFHSIVVDKETMLKTAKELKVIEGNTMESSDFLVLARLLMESDLNSLKKLSSTSEKQSPFSVDSYLRMHKSIAVGDKLIGQSALNTIGTIKVQDINGDSPIVLKPEYQFSITGDGAIVTSNNSFHVLSINPVKSYDGSLVSSSCAQTSAAFVDHGKYPTAEGANLNTKTFDLLAALMRIGIPLKQAIIVMNLPYIYEETVSKGTVRKPGLSKIRTKEKDSGVKILDEDLSIQQVLADSLEYFYTKSSVKELKGNQNLTSEEKAAKIKEFKDRIDFLRTKHLGLISKIVSISKVVQIYTNDCKIDSVKGSIKSSLGEVFNQLETYTLNNYTLREYLQEGFIDFKTGIGNKFSSGGKFDYKKLAFSLQESSRVPDVQAALTATELAQQTVLDVFGIGNPTFLGYVDMLMANSGYNTYQTAEYITAFCEEFSAFVASQTELLGDSEEGTYDSKYLNAVNYFPIQMRFVMNSDIWRKSPMHKMSVFKYLMPTADRAGNTSITLRRFSGMTEEDRSAFRRELDHLWEIAALHKDENIRDLAKDIATGLFLHAYYKHGLIPRSDGYSGLFTRFYLSHFPEYLNSLNRIQTGEVFTSEILDRYLSQFYSNHCREAGFKSMLKGYKIQELSDNYECEIPVKSFIVNRTESDLNVIPTHIIALYGTAEGANYVIPCEITDKALLNVNYLEDNNYNIKYKAISINPTSGLRYNANSSDISKITLSSDIPYTEDVIIEEEDFSNSTTSTDFEAEGKKDVNNENESPMC